MGERWLTELLSDYMFLLPAIRLAEDNHRAGGQNWMMRLEYTSSFPPFNKLGPCHIADVPLIWEKSAFGFGPDLTDLRTEQDRQVGHTMQDAILAFARTSDPRTERVAAWVPYEPGRRATMLVNRESQLTLDPRSNHRQAWDRLPLS